MLQGNQAGFCAEIEEAVTGDLVRRWFEDPVAIKHYVRATAAVGLWSSEEKVFPAAFSLDQRILDVGCGTGRITFGLWKMGFRRLAGVDFSPAMIEAARDIGRALGADIPFQVGDATCLEVPAPAFDGAIFGFNGLMQIPGRANRRKALRCLRALVAGGGKLVFTSHDRAFPSARAHWRQTSEGTLRPPKNRGELEFGDRVGRTEEGSIFMHWPDRTEVLDDLAATGWRHLEDHARSLIANESEAVRAFSDECRFWICRKE